MKKVWKAERVFFTSLETKLNELENEYHIFAVRPMEANHILVVAFKEEECGF